MPIDVREAFLEVIKKEANVPEEQAEMMLQQLEKLNRYQVETWS
jgi:sulfite reductase alpha subunit-like flavoprotein